MLLSGYVQDFPDFDIIRLISLIIEYIFKKEVILLDILRQKLICIHINTKAKPIYIKIRVFSV
jgi:hypothetical protein